MHNYWETKELYQKLFGEKIDMNSKHVKNFRSLLEKLPKQDTYTIITYGSLMNENDSMRTLSKQLNRFNCYITGYDRIFNVGFKKQGSFLNIIPNQITSPLYCIGIEISYKEIPFYIKREGLYNLVPIKYHLFDEVEEFTGFTVISNFDDYGIEPQLNYFHLCLDGIKEEMGKQGVDNFLDTTLCYSTKECDYVKAREWLKTTNFLDYMIRHSYSPR